MWVARSRLPIFCFSRHADNLIIKFKLLKVLMKNIIKNLAIVFLFIAIMYVLFVFEFDTLLKITFVLFVVFLIDMVWRLVHLAQMRNPDYIAKNVAKVLKKWRTDTKFWLDRDIPEYIELNSQINEIESTYFKLFEKFIHDKNKQLEIVKDWATFVSSSFKMLDSNSDDIDSDIQKNRTYLKIRMDEIKKRFDKLSKE